jgi:hypothetical protein
VEFRILSNLSNHLRSKSILFRLFFQYKRIQLYSGQVNQSVSLENCGKHGLLMLRCGPEFGLTSIPVTVHVACIQHALFAYAHSKIYFLVNIERFTFHSIQRDVLSLSVKLRWARTVCLHKVACRLFTVLLSLKITNNFKFTSTVHLHFLNTKRKSYTLIEISHFPNKICFCHSLRSSKSTAYRCRFIFLYNRTLTSDNIYTVLFNIFRRAC